MTRKLEMREMAVLGFVVMDCQIAHVEGFTWPVVYRIMSRLWPRENGDVRDWMDLDSQVVVTFQEEDENLLRSAVCKESVFLKWFVREDKRRSFESVKEKVLSWE